jgi:N-acyl-phosphatidylethanolamine-hydrolysing phospholipase D
MARFEAGGRGDGIAWSPRMRRVFRRRTIHLLSAVLVSLCAFMLADLVSPPEPAPASDRPAHHLGRGFRNVDPNYVYPIARRVGHVVGRPPAPDRGDPLELVDNDGAELRTVQTLPALTWVGHSTFLVQLDGVNVLTDPHWGSRTSPVSFLGPRRLVPPGLRFQDLPPIHAVVISHDHYDHLDLTTVRRLAREHRPRFFVPLGLRSWFRDAGIDDVVELDWWQSGRMGAVTLTCTPAQHSSGRAVTLHDQNQRLWSSWAIASPTRRFYFAGDTGYFAGFGEIGRRLGPFDVAALPIGGYSDYSHHHPNHVNPEESVRAFQDLGARLLVPMHWGTFELNREAYREPPDRLLREAHRHGLEESVAILSPGQTIRW